MIRISDFAADNLDYGGWLSVGKRMIFLTKFMLFYVPLCNFHADSELEVHHANKQDSPSKFKTGQHEQCSSDFTLFPISPAISGLHAFIVNLIIPWVSE